MPPANLQKSRRRCIDFGLGRTPTMPQISPSPPPLSPDDSNLVTPPLAVHAGHDSDTSSLFDDIEMVFPQPPPIFTSLRRVHSSPLLTTKETCIAKNDKQKHGDRKFHDYASSKHRSVLYAATSAEAGHCASMDTPDGLLELESELALSSKSSVMNAIQSRPLAARTPESHKHGRRMNHVPTTLSASKSQTSINFLSPSRTIECPNVMLCNSKYTFTAVNPGASAMTGKGKKLSHARSTSSLLPLPRITQKEKMMAFATFGPTCKTLPKVKSVVPVAASDSWHYQESNLRKPKALCPRRLDCHGSLSYQVDSKPVSHPSLTSLACSGQQKTTKRAHLSNPFTSSSLVPLRPLGSPFHHRPTGSQPIAHATMRSDPSPYVPKSFIDITPEQDMRDFTLRSRRELMRTLLVRASRGVLNWGQALTQRTKPPKSMYEA